jgi:non-heme chloroperoxidase
MRGGPMGLDDALLARKVFKTNDGIELSVIDVGAGRPFVIVPAWTSSALEYYATIFDLARDHRVVAVDMRSHGASEKTPHGHRISRYAADLKDALECLELRDTTLMGHSMGCSVIWCYLDLFRSDRVSSIILVDQAATQLIQPQWSADERLAFGCTHTAEELFEHCRKLAGSEGEAYTQSLFTSIFTRGFPREELDWILSQTLAMPREHASVLMLDHAQRDWRDVISRIDVPALAVGARQSIFSVESQEWIARQIRRAQLAVFEEHEGGSHFMCFENPSHFNRIVRSFLSAL